MSLLWNLIIDIAVLSGHDITYVTIIVLGEAKFFFLLLYKTTESPNYLKV